MVENDGSALALEPTVTENAAGARLRSNVATAGLPTVQVELFSGVKEWAVALCCSSLVCFTTGLFHPVVVSTGLLGPNELGAARSHEAAHRAPVWPPLPARRLCSVLHPAA
jgi:hypothetical protein